MSAPESIAAPRRIDRIVILMAFAIGLLTPLVGYVGGWSGDITELEYRDPAMRPDFPRTLSKLRTFPAELDAYLEDHFGFRSRLLSLNSRLHVAIGVSPAPKFLLGKEGWFFHRTAMNVLDQHRGIDRFSEEELESWGRTMEKRQRWLAERGVGMLIAIAPNKHAIYPEYVPDWATIVNSEGRYQQLRARLAEGSTLELVDLHAPLRNAKRRDRVYHKTDGHWNELGAHVAYTAIARRIRERFPTLPLRPLHWFDIDWVFEPFGVMTQRLNIADSMPEKLPRLRPRSGTRVIRTYWPDGVPDALFGELHATKVIESDLPDQPTVVFVRDSFATDLAIFAQESFRKTVLLHHGYGRFRLNLIMGFEPDIVVYEMLEWGLAWELK